MPENDATIPWCWIEGLDKTYHSVDSALSGVSLSVGKG
jgi:hypothetical protein